MAHLLTMETQALILILGTTSSEAVTAGSDTESTFNRLLAHPHAHKLTLAPLDWAGQVNLMAELLGLEPGLATDVASKCGGNPQFAVQLVGDWVERGLLIPGPEGFEPHAGLRCVDPSQPARCLERSTGGPGVSAPPRGPVRHRASAPYWATTSIAGSGRMRSSLRE